MPRPSDRAPIAWQPLALTAAAVAVVAALAGLLSRPSSTTPGVSWLNAQVAAGLARWLVPPSRPGESLVPTIRFEQPWPQLVGLLVLGLAIALIVWFYRRETSAPMWYRMLLAGLRISLVLLAMFLLSEAVLSVERTGLPTFAILVDDSASTSITDAYTDPALGKAAARLARNPEPGAANRLAVARGWLEADDARLLRELQRQHRLRMYLVSSAPRLLTEVDRPDQVAPALAQLQKVESSGVQTRLGDSVRQVLTELRGAPPSAILLLTDGQTTEGESLTKAADFARSKGVPLYAIGLGDPAPTRDLELTDLLVDEVVFVDDQVRFQARLGGHGFQGEKVDVVLRKKPAQAPAGTPGEEVGRATVTAPADGQSTPVEVKYRPTQTGESVFELVVEPRPRELQKDNNRVARAVSVREEKIKVLLADGEPRYEFRYLLSMLKRDKTVALQTLLQTADPEFSEQEATALPTFPTAKEGPDGLFAYDVVIFGDLDPSFLSASQLQNLVEFVEQKGGGLMLVAGQSYNPLAYRGTPLEALIPIKLDEARDPNARGTSVASFQPTLTAEGRGHPIFRFADDEQANAQVWQSLAPLDWFLEAPRKQELAFVLAAHPSVNGTDGPVPLLLYQFVGAGKVLFQGFDETWKWRFRVGDRYFGRYWIQAVRFLARSKLLGKQAEITTDRRRYQRQQPIRVQVRFPNAGLAPASGRLQVEVARQGQGPRKLELKRSPAAANLFEGVLPQAAEGSYDVRLLPPPVLDGGMPSTSFSVAPPAGEFEKIPMAAADLQRATAASRGRFFTPIATASNLLEVFPPPKTVPLDTDPPILLWNHPAILGLFLALLVAEWLLRKRKQMV